MRETMYYHRNLFLKAVIFHIYFRRLFTFKFKFVFLQKWRSEDILIYRRILPFIQFSVLQEHETFQHETLVRRTPPSYLKNNKMPCVFVCFSLFSCLYMKKKNEMARAEKHQRPFEHFWYFNLYAYISSKAIVIMLI